MIEPTESESVEELNLFIDAMRAIAKEVEETPELVKSAPPSPPASPVWMKCKPHASPSSAGNRQNSSIGALSRCSRDRAPLSYPGIKQIKSGKHDLTHAFFLTGIYVLHIAAQPILGLNFSVWPRFPTSRLMLACQPM